EAPALPASGPGPASPPATRAAAEPADRFAPPGGEEAEAIVDLADDELAHRARKRLTAPPPIAEATARAPFDPAAAGRPAGSDPAARRSRPPSSEPPVRWSAASIAAPPSPATPEVARTAPAPESWSSAQLSRLAAPRARLAAGVLLSILLGFVPAMIVASVREGRAFRAIDAKVSAIQRAVDSEDGYDALDGFRAEQLRQKRSARQMIALTSMLIWAVAGGGLAYVWFKRVPWDRFA
ncbi:MAG: hypothetical protein ABIY55_03675, partial [Kofleriaceae bacterium]